MIKLTENVRLLGDRAYHKVFDDECQIYCVKEDDYGFIARLMEDPMATLKVVDNKLLLLDETYNYGIAKPAEAVLISQDEMIKKRLCMDDRLDYKHFLIILCNNTLSIEYFIELDSWQKLYNTFCLFIKHYPKIKDFTRDYHLLINEESYIVEYVYYNGLKFTDGTFIEYPDLFQNYHEVNE